MKKLMTLCTALVVVLHTYAQNTPYAEGIAKTKLPTVFLPANSSIHFLSPEPIQYVDISNKKIAGDLPLKNVFRLRLKDSMVFEDAVITIVGENFIAQYRLLPATALTERDARSEIEIVPADVRPLDISGIGLTQAQMKSVAFKVFSDIRGGTVSHSKAYGLKGYVNHIYTLGDYLFLDIGFENSTNLPYAIDDLRFKVDDKEITKATNIQSVDILPEYRLLPTFGFKKHYRNIFVLKKLSFPGNKVLHIEMSEKQVSGRVISLRISYQDVLDADVVPIK